MLKFAEARILPFPMPGDGPFPVPVDGDFHILPIAVGEPHPGGRPIPDGTTIPGAPPRIEIVVGTEGDDRLVLAAGDVARGGGGNDVFVLTSAGTNGGPSPERLGYIADFDEDDTLDLSGLGQHAAILSREGAPMPFGPERILIDYDADGDADGILLASSGRAPDLSDHRPMPMPTPAPLPRADLPYDGSVSDAGDVASSPPTDLSVSFGLIEGWL